MRKGPFFLRVGLWAMISLPTFLAAASGDSSNWSRVNELKPDTRVVVLLSTGESVTGWLVEAGIDSMTVRVGNQMAGSQNQVITRDTVKQVAIENFGRRWYSIPLVAIAEPEESVTRLAVTSNATPQATGAREEKGLLSPSLRPVPRSSHIARRAGQKQG